MVNCNQIENQPKHDMRNEGCYGAENPLFQYFEILKMTNSALYL